MLSEATRRKKRSVDANNLNNQNYNYLITLKLKCYEKVFELFFNLTYCSDNSN